jgi:hypothetical protein
MFVCVGLERGKSLLAKAIRWFTGGEFNHVFIAFGESKAAQFVRVVEADAEGVHTSWLADRKHNKCVIRELPLRKDINPYELFDALYSYVGKPYGYLQLFGFAVPSLLERVGINIKNFFKHGIICSELFWLISNKICDKKSIVYNEIHKFDKNTFDPNDVHICTNNSECPEVKFV